MQSQIDIDKVVHSVNHFDHFTPASQSETDLGAYSVIDVFDWFLTKQGYDILDMLQSVPND